MSGCRVLVVDDEPEVRAVVSLILEDEGYQVALASNGAEALKVLSQAEPDCVLLDMRMPVLDGWGFARELAARHLTIPVLVMTAAQDAPRWCREIHAAGCLGKPFGMDELLATVEQVCGEPGPGAG